MTAQIDAAEHLAALSRNIDQHNAHRDPEAILWGRVAKVGEEAGEVIGALVGVTGQNPRKGRSHTEVDLVGELLDTAVAALGAVEHRTGNQGFALQLLYEKIATVQARALSVALPALDDDVEEADYAFHESTPVTYIGADLAVAARFDAHSIAHGRGDRRRTLVVFDRGVGLHEVPTGDLVAVSPNRVDDAGLRNPARP